MKYRINGWRTSARVMGALVAVRLAGRRRLQAHIRAEAKHWSAP